MKNWKTLTRLSILITTPSLFAYPQHHLPHLATQNVNWFGDWWWGPQDQATKWVRPTTYDEIIQMLDDLESGELERRYPKEQLEHVNEYLAILAKEGILPGEFDEEAALKKDLDEVTDLVKVFPQLCEEVKELGDKFLPESLKLPASGEPVSPIENHENLVAKGHEVIDNVFSTDQAELFTAEARANDPMNNFAIGMPPLPGGIPKLFSNTNNLIRAGNAIDRAGFTRVGRGLMKHGNREGSVFPKPFGNSAEMNKRGQMILEEILHDPKRTILKNNRGGIEIYSQSGRGAYFREDGTFRGFIEYGHK